MTVNHEKEDGESRFQKLLAEFGDDDKSKLRLHEVKLKSGYSENDVLWKFVHALEYYQRMYEAMPEAIEQATATARNDACLLAESSVALFAAQAIESVSNARDKLNATSEKSIERASAAGDKLNAAIEKSTVEATGKITKAVIDEMHGAISQRNKIDDMIKGAANKLVVLATVTSAIVFDDLVDHARGAVDDLPAKYSDLTHFINYLCNIPISAAVVPLISYLIITILLKWFDLWGDENVARINENGGFVGIAKRIRENQK